MEFHEKLLKLRKEKGLSQEELGMALSVSRQTISKWESGQSYPDFAKLVMLSDFFEMTLDALVKDIDVQAVREDRRINEQMAAVYQDWQNAKKFVRLLGKICVGIVVGVVIIAIVSGILHMIYPASDMFWRTY